MNFNILFFDFSEEDNGLGKKRSKSRNDESDHFDLLEARSTDIDEFKINLEDEVFGEGNADDLRRLKQGEFQLNLLLTHNIKH